MQKYGIKNMLGIPDYSIKKVELKEKEIKVWLEPDKRKKARCGKCGRYHKKGQHSFGWVNIKDLEISGRGVCLCVLKRRYVCTEDMKVHTEEIEWLRLWGRVTKRYAEHVSRLTAITTNQEAGWYLGIDDGRVYRIDKDILEEGAKKKLEPPPAAKNISVDEVSYRKYHKYLTNVIDVDKKKVIWNAKGRTIEVMDNYYTGIGGKNCKNIESVALDGARSYISSASKHAVNALIVYDKFHIISKLNGAVDTVRKQELRKARSEKNTELVELINCKQRFILLKNKNNLTERQSGYLEKLCGLNEQIFKAMLLKESFLQIYSYSTEDDARKHLISWVKEACSCSLDAFNDLGKSFFDKMKFILNWFKKRISSAISEGFNNKIKRLKRMAYGYKDVDYLLLKIHQHCGLLNPRLTTL